MGISKYKNSFIAISIGLALGFFLQLFFQLCIVNGDSMYPTLESSDFIFAVKTNVVEVEVGDIVIVDSSGLVYTGVDTIIKRVIAGPGDTIRIVEDDVYVNDELLEEDYISDGVIISLSEIYYELGDNEYFIMGDNRANSTDSRIFGTITGDEILAKYYFSIF